ncbi:EpsG family protein [Marnyiella aurantia]|uniref:EpsG family protein n=1 Tax=Marnyiella aurantia TaxID=2758037 RepID=A0A7D7LRM2_9FLAO|nr:EpsG family protein [Marnyiella aurantia]MBA5247417.1 EpsG family protein [Marnyiella aurantia]QMS99174.1 EpsG family protein [Marnyiella aurantia]
MLYYLLPSVILMVMVSMMYISKLKLKSYATFLFLACLPAIVISVLSGDSGTDKESYYGWIGNSFNGNSEKVTYEPGFKYLSLLLSYIYPSVYFIIPAIALLTTLILIKSYSNSKYQLLIFTFLLFPYFYFDMTMNGLRYGLSFALVSLAAHQLSKPKKNSFLFFVFALLAVSMQYSSFLMVVLIYLSQVNFKKIHLLFLVVVGYAVVSILDFEYFDNKVDVYNDISRPSGISGLSPLILFFTVFLFNWYLQKKLSWIYFVILGLEILSFLLSLKSYSGLRFQTLMMFTLLIFIAHFQTVQVLRKRLLAVFFMIACLSLSLKMRNFMNEEKFVETPFIPYEFFWERR